jgi:hypothetical protein
MFNWTECTDRSTKSHSEESLCYSTQIHDVTGELETRVKEKFPQIARVTIHPEAVEGRQGVQGRFLSQTASCVIMDPRREV